MSEAIMYGAALQEMSTAVDLDQLEPGIPFSVTWIVENNGDRAWDGAVSLVYTDEEYPETADFPHTNLASSDSFALTELGEGGAVVPGDTAFLTFRFTAPGKPDTYWTGWQMQTGSGERFGPVLELRATVIVPLEKGVGELSYDMLGFENSFTAYNNMPGGQKFRGTWTIRNSGFDPWSGNFQIKYTPQKTADTNDAASIPMGLPETQRLGDLIGKEAVSPGETILIPLNFGAPEEPGIYAFQWQLMDEAGEPFGGTRWMRIVVRQPDGLAPPPPMDSDAYSYQGPQVTFFTGIHGPASDWMWGDGGFKKMMTRLNMPIFYWSVGGNKDNSGFGDISRNAVRLYWAPRPISAEEAYAEIRDSELRPFWDRGYRRFVFFNEPQFDAKIAGIEEGFGIAWKSADEFGDFLKICLQRARADFPGIHLYTTPMSSNEAFAPWHWRERMWAHVNGLVDGWCMHAYTGNNVDVEAAANDIAGQVKMLQRRFRLQIPVFISEASVNRGENAWQKAQVAHRLHQLLSQTRGVEGVFWYAAEWDPNSDHNHEGWYRNGIADAYLQQIV